jgi:hypothetical protein
MTVRLLIRRAFEDVVEHRDAAFLPASCRGVQCPSRTVIVLCQHPELVDPHLHRPPLRVLNEGASSATPLERLLDGDLIEQDSGTPAVEAL